jgi:hypothetical protein
MRIVAEVTTIVCDVCGMVPATSYGIHKRTNAEWIIDLCDECATPIHDWEQKGRAPAGKRRKYRTYTGKMPDPEA